MHAASNDLHTYLYIHTNLLMCECRYMDRKYCHCCHFACANTQISQVISTGMPAQVEKCQRIGRWKINAKNGEIVVSLSQFGCCDFWEFFLQTTTKQFSCCNNLHICVLQTIKSGVVDNVCKCCQMKLLLPMIFSQQSLWCSCQTRQQQLLTSERIMLIMWVLMVPLLVMVIMKLPILFSWTTFTILTRSSRCGCHIWSLLCIWYLKGGSSEGVVRDTNASLLRHWTLNLTLMFAKKLKPPTSADAHMCPKVCFDFFALLLICAPN